MERRRRKISRHNFKEGDIVEGRVRSIETYGAFVRINEKNKIDGRIHISNIADKYIKDITNYINEGDQIRAKIINIDKDGKIALSLKDVPKNQRIISRSERKKYKYIPKDTDKIISKSNIDNFYLQMNYYINDLIDSDKKEV